MGDRMTAADLRASQKAKDSARVKNAKPTHVAGVRFDSKKEANRWMQLRALEEAGRICRLERQVPIILQGAKGPIKTPTGRAMRYVADFRYIDWDRDGITVIEDVKPGNFRTEIYQIKRAILAAQGVEIFET